MIGQSKFGKEAVRVLSSSPASGAGTGFIVEAENSGGARSSGDPPQLVSIEVPSTEDDDLVKAIQASLMQEPIQVPTPETDEAQFTVGNASVGESKRNESVATSTPEAEMMAATYDEEKALVDKDFELAGISAEKREEMRKIWQRSEQERSYWENRIETPVNDSRDQDLVNNEVSDMADLDDLGQQSDGPGLFPGGAGKCPMHCPHCHFLCVFERGHEGLTTAKNAGNIRRRINLGKLQWKIMCQRIMIHQAFGSIVKR